MAVAVEVRDPRNEREYLSNEVFGVYADAGLLYIAFGVSRPKASTAPGLPDNIDREIICRAALPRDLAKKLASAILNVVKDNAPPIGIATN